MTRSCLTRAVMCLVPVAFALVLGGCADSAGVADQPPTARTAASSPVPPTLPATLSPAVSADDVVVVTPGNDIVSVTPTGTIARRLGHLRSNIGDEVDAIDVSRDGSHILLSVVNDHDSRCTATVFSLGTDGRLHHLVDGGAATFSPSGHSVAYLRYVGRGVQCYRAQLVVREVEDGSEVIMPLPGGYVPEGNPSEWPLNWSPDGTKIAYVGPQGSAMIATVGERHAHALDAGTFTPKAPVFLSDEIVAAYTGCCTGSAQQMTTFPLAGLPSTRLFSVVSPVRSVRRDRGGDGLWLTTEQSGTTLWHWDGSQLHGLPVQALITSG